MQLNFLGKRELSPLHLYLHLVTHISLLTPHCSLDRTEVHEGKLWGSGLIKCRHSGSVSQMKPRLASTALKACACKKCIEPLTHQQQQQEAKILHQAITNAKCNHVMTMNKHSWPLSTQLFHSFNS